MRRGTRRVLVDAAPGTYVLGAQTRTIDDDGCIASDALHTLEQTVTVAAAR